MLALFLIWLCVLVEILQIDFTKSIEDLENVGQKLLIYLLFAVIEVLILRIEALNICLRSDEFLHERDELTATHVIDEIKNDKWQAEFEVDLHEIVLPQISLRFLGIVDFICLVYEKADNWAFLVLSGELLGTLSPHFTKALVSHVLSLSLARINCGLRLDYWHFVFGRGCCLSHHLHECILVGLAELRFHIGWVS